MLTQGYRDKSIGKKSRRLKCYQVHYNIGELRIPFSNKKETSMNYSSMSPPILGFLDGRIVFIPLSSPSLTNIPLGAHRE